MAVTREELESLDVSAAAAQWTKVMARPAPRPGQRQGNYLPIEQILAFAALFLVGVSARLLVPAGGPLPGREYLSWHRQHIWVNHARDT